MSLVLTELSEAGIAMAADSAILYMENGNITTKNRATWKKLLRVPRITAGVSYWGTIGLITSERFDDWLDWRIGTGVYDDIFSFAHYLATELNKAAGGELIKKQACAGIHVAGIQIWKDGVKRPVFLHIHNGHLATTATVTASAPQSKGSSGPAYWTFPTGSALSSGTPQILSAAADPTVRVSYEIVPEPRKEFMVHHDFSAESMSSDVAEGLLKTGYIFHNGDYLPYKLVSIASNIVSTAMRNLGSGVSESRIRIGPRVGVLHRQMEEAIDHYKANGWLPIIDRPVTVLGIRSDGLYFDDDDFSRRSES
jgi:hypothetical protein